ncbi:MAG: pantoate--beta-alanine ligase [Halobacteriovoraceae bacterium]|nr:pantoate--beta-alanine ligase [Halobacteriovoraceae bacterium]
MEFLSFRNEMQFSNLGLVPTMGNLHQGHLNLVEKALKDNEKVVVTIFVNPKQFGPNEDFDKYPRTLEKDMEKLKSLKDFERIILFCPKDTSQIFPEDYSTDIEVHGLDRALCGKNRPGHFKGVCTVVYRLFLITKPTKAYFGQKDYQQFKIIKKMRDDLLIPVDLEMIPISREESGLALSSRNQYLSKEQRSEALLLNRSLNSIAEITHQNLLSGITKAQEILTQDSRFQYIEVLDAENLGLPTAESEKVVVAGAFLLGDTRLIDNVILKLKD